MPRDRRWGPDVLRPTRRAKGLSQVQLAARAGCTQAAISQIEHGAASPSDDLARRLEEALAVPVAPQTTVIFVDGLADLHGARILRKALRAFIGRRRDADRFIDRTQPTLAGDDRRRAVDRAIADRKRATGLLARIRRPH